jgi:DNA mismatch repair protein MutL
MHRYMPIKVLSDTLVSRIAAGEVVERPASVVKELVENAIDAGATDIRVESADGGKRLIRITDNGSGIASTEVELAFTHHATSKLSDVDDLQSLRTLGFRGEALASIASVSQVTCITRRADETSGTLIRIDNGEVVTHERNGRPAGTTMTIEHLFSRVPARLKFLKSNQTERGQIDGVITRYAMAYPHIRFALIHDGKPSFQTTGSGALRDVLLEVYGAETAEQMVPVGDDPALFEMRDGGPAIRVRGFAALPTINHANRSRITLFVNGRPVGDTKLSYAVIQAYHTLLMTGRYPIAVILVEVPPTDVDVNVHPAKAEVRFRDADAVFSAMQRAIRKALLMHMTPPEPPSVFKQAEAGAFAGEPVFRAPAAPDSGIIERTPPAQRPLAGSETWDRIGIPKTSALDTPDAAIPMPPAPQPVAARAVNLPALRILGQLAASYILAEGPEGLYLIDQHAAHERILFEKMMAQLDQGGVPSQALLDPVAVDVPADTAYLLLDKLDALREIGLEIETFGGNTFLVRGVPQLMAQDDIGMAVREMLADIELGDAPLRREFEARVLRKVCKRLAIKAGRVLGFAEMQALVRDLEACESPRTCPHGRPTMIQIGVAQLEREFGRRG